MGRLGHQAAATPSGWARPAARTDGRTCVETAAGAQTAPATHPGKKYDVRRPPPHSDKIPIRPANADRSEGVGGRREERRREEKRKEARGKRREERERRTRRRRRRRRGRHERRRGAERRRGEERRGEDSR